MYDPILRVLTVLEILQARDFVTGAELAERLEVDLRTVQRYIVRLKDLSIPIDSSRAWVGRIVYGPAFGCRHCCLRMRRHWLSPLDYTRCVRLVCRRLHLRQRVYWPS